MKKQVPLTPVVAAALVIVALVAFFVVLKPKMDAGSQLDAEIAELETKIAAASRPKPKVDGETVEIDVADLFLLAKAMPDSDDMPGIILELNSIAGASGIRFVSIQPQPQAAAGAYRTLPIALTFEGNYYDLTDFIYRLRSLVRVDDGALTANGRLYTLDQIDLHEAEEGFPSIEAVLIVSAYAFGPGSSAPAAPPAAPAATSSTTTATTTGATTTAPTTTTTEDTTQDAAGATN